MRLADKSLSASSLNERKRSGAKSSSPYLLAQCVSTASGAGTTSQVLITPPPPSTLPCSTLTDRSDVARPPRSM